jgi:hypothetical protein
MEGPEREEFFVDHWHVFSATSLTVLARRAGLWLQRLERLREPSGKYTLQAFLVPAPGTVVSGGDVEAETAAV